MELIKAILLDLETNCSASSAHCPSLPSYGDFEGLTNDELLDHCRLIAERGLAVGSFVRSGWVFTSLTWEGHDFIDNARDNNVWKATLKSAGHLSFGVFVEVLKSVAIEYAKSMIKIGC